MRDGAKVVRSDRQDSPSRLAELGRWLLPGVAFGFGEAAFLSFVVPLIPIRGDSQWPPLILAVSLWSVALVGGAVRGWSWALVYPPAFVIGMVVFLAMSVPGIDARAEIDLSDVEVTGGWLAQFMTYFTFAAVGVGLRQVLPPRKPRRHPDRFADGS
jgi:hypothetical protein